MYNSKQIKRLFPITMLLVLVALTGCGSDGGGNPTGSQEGSIVGSWSLVAIKSAAGGQVYNVPSDEVLADPIVHQFNENGTGITIYQGRSAEFQWTQSGNTLVTTNGSEVLTYTYTVNSNNLTLSFQSDQFTVTHTFART